MKKLHRLKKRWYMLRDLFGISSQKYNYKNCYGKNTNDKETNNKEILLQNIKNNCPYVSVFDGKHNFLFNSKDNVILNSEFINHGFEESNLYNFFCLSKKFYHNPSGIFLEVGGNVGTTTIKALDNNDVSKVITFEPATENYKMLKINKILNGYDNNKIEIYQKAVSNKSGGFLEIGICEENFGDCRIEINKHTDRKTEKVSVISIDDFICENNIDIKDIGFMWVDTQGFDVFVMDGAKKILESKIPVMIEFWPKVLKENNALDLQFEIIKKYYDKFVIVNEMSDNNIKTYSTKTDIQKIIQYIEDRYPKIEECDLFFIK